MLPVEPMPGQELNLHFYPRASLEIITFWGGVLVRVKGVFRCCKNVAEYDPSTYNKSCKKPRVAKFVADIGSKSATFEHCLENRL